MISQLKTNKGLTMIEVIIVMAIFGVVATLSFDLFFFSNKIFEKGTDQYTVQSNMRIASFSVSESVRYATEVEVESDKPASFTDPYSYIYHDSGTKQVLLSYINELGNRETRILGSEVNSLQFTKNSNHLVYLTLAGTKDDQNYDISKEIGLPNLEIQNTSVIGTTGKALKFYQDTTVASLALSGEVRLNRETNFDLIEGESFTLVANRPVTWSISSGSGISLGTTESKSVEITASGSVGSSATIRATSIADTSQWREVSVTVSTPVYMVEIVNSDLSEITGSLNIILGNTKDLYAKISPNLDPGEYTSLVWTTSYDVGDDAYLKIVSDIDEKNVTIEGIDIGGNANLTVQIELLDGSIIANAVIVNVQPHIEYAKLTGLSFNRGTLSPAFDPDITSYTISGSGGTTVTTNSTVGTNVVIDSNQTAVGVTSFNLSQSLSIQIDVSEPGKLSRSYYITN